MSIRPVRKPITSKPTLEGAGVHLRRVFGFGETSDYDPFLLLDDSRNDVPEDYLVRKLLQKPVSDRATLRGLTQFSRLAAPTTLVTY